MEISQNFPNWRWDGRRERAASLLAADELTDEKIAAEVGITRRQLTNWRQVEVFKARVQENVAEIRASALRFPIAKKHYRVGVVDMLHTKALTVIEERAAEYAKAEEDEAMAAVRKTFGEDVPAGGGTGLLVGQLKQVRHVYEPDPDDADGTTRVVMVERWEYAVDTGLIREITNLHARAAKELGQEDEAAPAAKVDVRLYVGINVEAV